MKVLLIRHGSTPGNLKHQYVGGRTDQHLSEEGIRSLEEIRRSGVFPEAGHVFVSPMIRCAETAQVLFPGAGQSIVEDLKEMDFGIFEGRSAAEMEGEEAYQKWVDSMCEDPIPEGENRAEFTERCCRAFREVMKEVSGKASLEEEAGSRDDLKERQPEVFVIHGGTIMAILSCLGKPERGYYDWYVKNGHGFYCDWDGEHLLVEKEV